MYEVLKGLEPRCYFEWFGAITEIPRGSCKEEKIIAFCRDFAEVRDLFCDIDESGNVFMRVPATEGYEDEPAILLQAHLDMVWVKEPGVEFDFENEPIKIVRRDNWIMGDGTTLGADNGVGVATMLALADAKDIPHPPLELLFTVEEEIGLKGIRRFDMSKITARRMLNMDCGYTHEICVSSAGSIKAAINKAYPVVPVNPDDVVLEVAITGGKGGHSGIMIRKGRACAANEMGELIAALNGISVKLCCLETAEKAILGACKAVICVPREDEEVAKQLLEQRFEEIRSIFSDRDPDLKLTISDGTADGCTDPKAAVQIFTALRLLRTGLLRLSENDPPSTITSGAVTNSYFREGKLRISYSIRSANTADMDATYRKLSALAGLLDMEFEKLDRYPGWPERAESAFREKFIDAHQRICGFPAQIERVHGGIEIGPIVGAIPDMDAVGYAPTARAAHTTQEYLAIDEVEPFWLVLKDVLASRG